MKYRKYCVFALAAWSGFFIMVLELLGGRMISPYFGSSVYVWGSVIFLFMLALSLGYLSGGALSRHSPSITKLAGIIATAAVLVLPVVLFGEEILNWVFDLALDPRYGSLLACVVLFTLPTILLGMVSPYAISIIAGEPGRVGSDAGKLYFVSTVGSSAGTLMTAFYFVLWFELDTTLWSGIAITLMFAFAGLAFDQLTRPAKVVAP